MRALLPFALLAVAVGGCKKKSDRDLIDAILDQTIQAANDRHAGEVVAHAADDFKGPMGADLHECRRILTGYFLQHGWVRVFEQSRTIDVKDTSATVALEVVVAVGRKVEKLEDLLPTDGSHLRFDVAMEKRDGEWRFATASYTRVH